MADTSVRAAAINAALAEDRRSSAPAWFVATHPDMFRCGEPALILGVIFVNNRACFRVRYRDGVEDDTPLGNEDFVGLGAFYEITSDGWSNDDAS